MSVVDVQATSFCSLRQTSLLNSKQAARWPCASKALLLQPNTTPWSTSEYRIVYSYDSCYFLTCCMYERTDWLGGVTANTASPEINVASTSTKTATTIYAVQHVSDLCHHHRMILPCRVGVVGAAPAHRRGGDPALHRHRFFRSCPCRPSSSSACTVRSSF